MNPQAMQIVITAQAGTLRASVIHTWSREDNLQPTPADTIRNLAIWLFAANSDLDRIALVTTGSGTPLMMGEAAHRWFHLGPEGPTPVNIKRMGRQIAEGEK